MRMTEEERALDLKEQRARRELKKQMLCHRPSRERQHGEKWYSIPACGAKVTMDARGTYKCAKGHEWAYL